jgi:hypothetical protein
MQHDTKTNFSYITKMLRQSLTHEDFFNKLQIGGYGLEEMNNSSSGNSNQGVFRIYDKKTINLFLQKLLHQTD